MVSKTLHINTISRNSAKELAPWAVKFVRVEGGFIAYESRQDIPKRVYIKNKKIAGRECPYKITEETKLKIEAKKLKSKYDKRRYKQKMELIGNKYFPFKNKYAFDKFSNAVKLTK